MCISDDSRDEKNQQMSFWPEFFDVDAVPPVRKTDLKQKPKLNQFKSMESLLQEFNIRD
jgi:hypothetical protein